MLCIFAHRQSPCRPLFSVWKSRNNRVTDQSSGQLSNLYNFSVPGDGGSQVDAKLSKPSTVHYFCDKTTKDWFNLWLNLELLAPLIIDCWTDNAKLHYNNVTRESSNSPGVETRIPGWGNPEVVEWIDPSKAVRINGDDSRNQNLMSRNILKHFFLFVETRRLL